MLSVLADASKTCVGARNGGLFSECSVYWPTHADASEICVGARNGGSFRGLTIEKLPIRVRPDASANMRRSP